MKKQIIFILLISLSIQSYAINSFLDISPLCATYLSYINKTTKKAFSNNPYVWSFNALGVACILAMYAHHRYKIHHLPPRRMYDAQGRSQCSGCENNVILPFGCYCGAEYCAGCAGAIKGNRCKCLKCNDEMDNIVDYYY